MYKECINYLLLSQKAEAVTPVVHQEPKKFFSTKRSNDYVLETVQLNGDEALAKIYGTGGNSGSL